MKTKTNVMNNMMVRNTFFLAAFAAALAITLVLAPKAFSADSIDLVETIVVQPSFYSINPCETHKFNAEIRDAKGQPVEDVDLYWASTNPEVALITPEGIAIALQPGYTEIIPVIGRIKGEPASLFVRDQGVPRECQLTPIPVRLR